MSLTSYRAAPPRAKRKRVVCAVSSQLSCDALCRSKPEGFVSCKEGTGQDLCAFLAFHMFCYFPFKRQKAALGRPLEFGQGP